MAEYEHELGRYEMAHDTAHWIKIEASLNPAAALNAVFLNRLVARSI